MQKYNKKDRLSRGEIVFFSPPRLPLKHHLLPVPRMRERDTSGVQIESVGAAAVEVVAVDGTVETFRVGAVDAQLVRAARERMQLHKMLAHNMI